MSLSKINVYQKRLDQVVDVLRGIGPKRIYEYGSRVWGKARPGSDIDLVMIVDKGVNTLKVKRKATSILWDNDLLDSPELDVHVVPEDIFEYRLAKGDPFISNVAKGKLVYESKNN